MPTMIQFPRHLAKTIIFQRLHYATYKQLAEVINVFYPSANAKSEPVQDPDEGDFCDMILVPGDQVEQLLRAIPEL